MLRSLQGCSRALELLPRTSPVGVPQPPIAHGPLQSSGGLERLQGDTALPQALLELGPESIPVKPLPRCRVFLTEEKVKGRNGFALHRFPAQASRWLQSDSP